MGVGDDALRALEMGKTKLFMGLYETDGAAVRATEGVLGELMRLIEPQETRVRLRNGVERKGCTMNGRRRCMSLMGLLRSCMR